MSRSKEYAPDRLNITKRPVYDAQMQRTSWHTVETQHGVSVYVLHFTDGAVYVGISNHVRQRIGEHKCKPVNRAVYTRLTNHGLAFVQILGVYESHEIAHQYETKAVVNFRDHKRNVLNMIATVSPTGFSKQVSTDVKDYVYKCRICKTVKPATEFHRDRTRSSGLGNKCKVCHCRSAGILQKAKLLGVNDPQVWQIFRDNPNLTHKTFPWDQFT